MTPLVEMAFQLRQSLEEFVEQDQEDQCRCHSCGRVIQRRNCGHDVRSRGPPTGSSSSPLHSQEVTLVANAVAQQVKETFTFSMASALDRMLSVSEHSGNQKTVLFAELWDKMQAQPRGGLFTTTMQQWFPLWRKDLSSSQRGCHEVPSTKSETNALATSQRDDRNPGDATRVSNDEKSQERKTEQPTGGSQNAETKKEQLTQEKIEQLVTLTMALGLLRCCGDSCSCSKSSTARQSKSTATRAGRTKAETHTRVLSLFQRMLKSTTSGSTNDDDDEEEATTENDVAGRRRIQFFIMAEGARAVLECMRSFSQSAAVQESALAVLLRLVGGGPYEDAQPEQVQHAAAIVQRGGMPTILASLQSFPHLASIQSNGFRVLCHLTTLGQHNEGTVREAGGVRLVVAAMKRHDQDAQVQGYGCRLLAKLRATSQEEVRGFTRKRTVIMSVLVAMQEHPLSVHVQREACDALSSFGGETENDSGYENNKNVAIAAMGGIGEILATLRQHEENVNVVRIALTALATVTKDTHNHLAVHFVATSTRGGRDGGTMVEIILAAMERYAEDAAIQSDGCEALWNASRHNRDNQNALLQQQEGRGVRLVVTAMQRYEEDMSVQARGSAILGNIMAIIGPTNFRTGAIILRHGGLTAVLTALKRHRNRIEVQEAGCFALGRLLPDVAPRASVEREAALAEGIDMVISIMKEHPKDPTLQERTCQALSRLQSKNMTVQQKRIIVEIVLVALQQHEDCVTLQVHGCKTLLNVIAGDDDSQHHLVSRGGIETLLHSIMSTKQVQNQPAGTAAAVLQNLARKRPFFQRYILSCGGAQILQNALQRCPHSFVLKMALADLTS